MSDLVAESCPWCGEADGGGGPRCGRCGGSLLVDVVVDGPPRDERTVFKAARAVSGLGPPARDFQTLKAVLAKPHAVVVERCARSFGRSAVAKLGAEGVQASLRPCAEVAKPASSLKRLPLLLALLPVFWLAWARVGLSVDLANTQEQVAALVNPERKPRPEAAAGALTVQQLGKRGVAASATVICGQKIGAGFFVAEDELLTNAHVACPVGSEVMTVRLGDGRELLGTTTFHDPWMDLARVKVVGAGVEPLAVGDPTTLEPGDPLVFVGSPRGLAFTVHEGKVSFVGRGYLGVGYVQFNASVNPGNSGGPLLNGKGEVVGVVSMKMADAEGIGLALPISYAVPPQGPAEARWKELLRKVKDDEDKALEQVSRETPYDEPELIAVKTDRPPFVVAVQRFRGAPQTTSLALELEGESGPVRCTMDVRLTEWRSLKAAAEKEHDLDRHLRWLLRTSLAEELHVGAGHLTPGSCTRRDLEEPGLIKPRFNPRKHPPFPADRDLLQAVFTGRRR